MEIFISWSGDLSRSIAEALKNWLPTTIQSLKPYFTPSDIEKGTKWDTEITNALNKSSFGIICLTPDNTASPYILFEAGALSNKLDKSRVCPLLFGLTNSDLTGPLATFQTTAFVKEEFKMLMSTINNNLGENKLSETVFNESFNTYFPKLESKINSILDSNKNKLQKSADTRTDRDILDEILQLTRRQYLKPRNTTPKIVTIEGIRYLESKVSEYLIENRMDLSELTEEIYNKVFEDLSSDNEIRRIAIKPTNLKRIIQRVHLQLQGGIQ